MIGYITFHRKLVSWEIEECIASYLASGILCLESRHSDGVDQQVIQVAQCIYVHIIVHTVWFKLTVTVNEKNENSDSVNFNCITEQETQLSLTNRVTHLCKRNGVADLLNTLPPHMC